jgi:hypothetical protein
MIRFLLVLVVVAVFVLCAAAMWWGWRNRARRQAAALPAFPALPAWWRDGEPERAPLLPVTSGVYVGTTTAGNWQDRIAVADIGFRAAAQLVLFDGGLVVSRTGASPLWIPAETLRAARTDRALAGKVMSADGLLVVRWQLGDHLLDSGFRGDDKDSYPRWVAELNRLAERHAPADRAPGVSLVDARRGKRKDDRVRPGRQTRDHRWQGSAPPTGSRRRAEPRKQGGTEQ